LFLDVTLTPCLACRGYKKQIEEAEEIAALNLAKFRQTQSVLTVAADEAGLAEQALAKAKTQASVGRGASAGLVSTGRNEPFYPLRKLSLLC
jgi:hypothetical protein